MQNNVQITFLPYTTIKEESKFVLTDELKEQIKQIIPLIGNFTFTGLYSRNLNNPNQITTNGIIDYLVMNRRMGGSVMGAKSALERDDAHLE